MLHKLHKYFKPLSKSKLSEIEWSTAIFKILGIIRDKTTTLSILKMNTEERFSSDDNATIVQQQKRSRIEVGLLQDISPEKILQRKK